MSNAFPFLSETPGRVRFAGPAKGSSNEAIFCGELGLSEAQLVALRDKDVI